MAKTKKPSARQLKDKLWKECKRLTRERWGNTCYTCGKPNLQGSDWQTGHGKPKSVLPLQFKFDVRNLRPQCMRCNIHHSGMTDIFIRKLEMEEEGIDFLEASCRFNEEDGTWIVRNDYPSLGGRDATIFVENLLKEYRSISYE